MRGNNLYETAVVLGCRRDRHARVGKRLPLLGFESSLAPVKIFELLLVPRLLVPRLLLVPREIGGSLIDEVV